MIGTLIMRNRALRHIAAILVFTLVLTLTVQAGPVTMSGVKQTVGGSMRSSKGTSSLRLSNPSSTDGAVSTSSDPNASTDPQQEGPTVQTGEEISVIQED